MCSNDDCKNKSISGDELVRIYEIYVKRIEHEGKMIWSRFTLYFTINSGLLSILFYVFTEHLTDKVSLVVSILLVMFSFSGLILSINWIKSVNNSIGWQNLMNEVISDFENHLNFSSKKLYTEIIKKDISKSIGLDVVALSKTIPKLFRFNWFVFLIINTVSLIKLLMQ